MILFTEFNPFDLQGPTFLVLYVTLLAGACFVAYFLRKRAAGPDPGPARSLVRADQDQDTIFRGVRFDAYEAAYLNGGPKLAIETAIATLVQSNALHLSFVDNTLSTVAGAPRGFHPLEQAVHRLVESGEANTVRTIRVKAAEAADRIATRLKALGLVIGGGREVISHVVPSMIMALVLLFGLVKVFVGIWRDRPIGFLFLLCCVTAFIAYRLYKSPSLRTVAGDETLERLKRENAALQSTAGAKPEGLASGDVALAMALFGMTALAFSDQSWSVLRKELFPPRPVSSGSSSCGGSSCGSSSSSCGSSCGGGCGGGGCGGCGS